MFRLRANCNFERHTSQSPKNVQPGCPPLRLDDPQEGFQLAKKINSQRKGGTCCRSCARPEGLLNHAPTPSDGSGGCSSLSACAQREQHLESLLDVRRQVERCQGAEVMLAAAPLSPANACENASAVGIGMDMLGCQ